MAINQDDGLHRSIRTLFGVGMTGGLSDGQLLERFLSRGDDAAFETLVAQHGPMELSQGLSRGAQEIRSHDHLSKKAVRDYEQACSSLLPQMMRFLMTKENIEVML